LRIQNLFANFGQFGVSFLNKGLPTTIENASSNELRTALRQHLEQTRYQVL